jgi:hypothetical protein
MNISRPKALGIVILWCGAVVASVYYVRTVIEERAKRKAIEEWKVKRLAEIKADRERAAR